MLREWQSECADKAIDKYQSGKQHFFCQATPGAGKTVLAAEIAKRLRKGDRVDLILCVSPSLAVSQSIQNTFSKALDCPFNGEIGSLGMSLTYQALKHLTNSFWGTLKKYRVFVVFDEIHHCSGNNIESANSWGEQILLNMQSLATYTLALSGTPWRTDKVPIAMAEYSNPEGKFLCDYRYSLKRAVQEKVCRSPKIVLVDNECLTIPNGSKGSSFSSIRELMKQSKLSYQTLIHNPEALRHLLRLGVEKLGKIRNSFSNAGGLIVASSVKHAEEIYRIITKEYGVRASIVTYQHDDALGKIEAFKYSSIPWIVSVGMISEGTDIPRLQVCCHISSVKTELYFRQVLGRILRVNGTQRQTAWLFTFAEESLVSFAEAIEEDIPNTYQFIRHSDTSDSRSRMSFLSEDIAIWSNQLETRVGDHSQFIWGDKTLAASVSPSSTIFEYENLKLGRFKQRVLTAFS